MANQEIFKGSSYRLIEGILRKHTNTSFLSLYLACPEYKAEACS